MFKAILFTSLLILLITLSLFSNNTPYTDDPVGEVFLFGNTWLDFQYYGSAGRQIQIDSEDWVHVVWMNSLDSGGSFRHIYYQLMDSLDNLIFVGPYLGIQVDQSPRAGYAALEVEPDNRAMPVFHELTAGSINAHSTLAFDYFPHIGAFASYELPWVYQGAQDLEVIWPRMDRDRDSNYHIVSTENPASGVAGAPMGIYYCRADYDPLNFNINFETNHQVLIAYTSVLASEVAASLVSNRVAIGWMEYDSTNGGYGNIGDLILCISPDGINWNWSDTMNVTNWIPPDPSQLPDTAAACQDTFRCAPSMCLLFGYDDVLHVFFTTTPFYYYYPYGNDQVRGNSFIWHWDEINQVFSLVADGWFLNNYYETGAWSYISHPSAGVDPATGDLFCLYERAFAPVDTALPFPYLWGDTVDFSAGGYPNSEIWITKSSDNGLHWAVGTNITDTQTPQAPPGLCLSEVTPSMAPDIVNGFCHITYISDKDAGITLYGAGTVTLNDVVYQRVPVTEIAPTPILPPYPMHCDSSGMPGYQYSIDITLSPASPPIIIPPAGGSFDYFVNIQNQENLTATFDAWIDVTLPDGSIYGPITNRILTLPGGETIFRLMTQWVPGGAPAGDYSYNGYVGNYPAVIWDSSSFVFTKTGQRDNVSKYDWPLSGWEEPLSASNPVVEFALLQPYPNPFNQETSLIFTLPQAGEISLVVYDVNGREVLVIAQGWYSAGEHKVILNGSALSSGIYFVRLKTDNIGQIRKIVLVK